jgi:hypothetical protein
MNRFMIYEEFQKTPKKKQKTRGTTDSYPPPEYLVQPAKGDKGFFLFKHAFDNMKKRFETGFFSTTVNNY